MTANKRAAAGAVKPGVIDSQHPGNDVRMQHESRADIVLWIERIFGADHF